MRETVLTARIVKALKAEGCYVVKHHGSPYGVAGVPDLLVCNAGRFIGLEVKAGKQGPTAAQWANLEQIEAAQGISAVVRSVDDALIAIQGPTSRERVRGEG